MWPFKKKRKTGKRLYAGARYDRLVDDWVAQGSSQDSEVKASLPRLRYRSRQLGRDNEYVRQFFRAVQNNVVGQGIPFQAQVRMQRGKGGKTPKLDDVTNSLIEAKWNEWCRAENCDTRGKLCFSEIERLVIRSVVESGEVLVRFVYQSMGSSKTPLALEVIESDLLDDNYNAVDEYGDVVRMGVAQNKWGRPTAYYFLPRHPGDYGVMPIEPQPPGRRIRVPAEDIIHLFPTERPGQSRGIPAVASAMMRLRQMQGYEEAEVIAARATACQMGFIETPEGELQGDDVRDGQQVEEFEPGKIRGLGPGEKFVPMNPTRPGGQFTPFIQTMLRGIAAGIGASYETISRDYSQSNYTSSRLALLEDRDNWRSIQWWMISHFHQAVFEKFLDMAVLSGDLSLKNYETAPELYRNVKWMPRGWSWVDPAKEVAAYQAAVRNGFMTMSDVVSQSGGDIEELMTQRAQEVDLADEYDLVFDSNPAQTNTKGIEQPSDTGAQFGDAPADTNASDTAKTTQ